MQNYEAVYRPVRDAEPVAADVRLTGSGFVVDLQKDDTVMPDWNPAHLELRYFARQDLTVVRPFPGSTESIAIEGRRAYDELSARIAGLSAPWKKKEKKFPWLTFYILCTIIIAIFIGLYLLLVPFLAEQMAVRVSPAREQQFGESVYQGLNLKADSSRSKPVNDFFGKLNVTTPYQIRISVVDGEEVKAFALPGGRIVVYTGLLDKLQSYPELAALLAHEFTHVQHKHATRAVFRRLGSSLFISMVTGNAGEVGAILGEKAGELGSLDYSRSLEKDADLNGLAILQQNKIDPSGFAQLFQRLKDGTTGQVATPELLASHPDIDARIAYVREAAGNTGYVTDSNLTNLFKQIKKQRW